MDLPVDVSAALTSGRSNDRSLAWRVDELRGAKEGAHLFRLWAWDGAAYRLAVMDVIGAG